MHDLIYESERHTLEDVSLDTQNIIHSWMIIQYIAPNL